jgi:RNA polymerase sigma factor (TIGR02999 family)
MAHRQGEPGAFDKLVGLVYPELRRIARRQLARRRPGLSLDTGAVVHEAYLKLVDQTRADWQDRNHFFAIAARGMRQVIIDYARRRQAQKRGGGHVVSLDDREVAVQAQAEQLVALNELLDGLEAENPRLSQVVDCRFFAGYTDEETGGAGRLDPDHRARLAARPRVAEARHEGRRLRRHGRRRRRNPG